MIIHTSIPSKKKLKKRKKKTSLSVTKSPKRKQVFTELKTDLYGHLRSNRGSSIESSNELMVGASGVCSTSKKQTLHYTGENLIGISVVHKSCLQPVFSREDAEEFSRMRRG